MIPGPALLVKGSGIATAVVQVTAVLQIESLAQELIYAIGVAIKKKKKKTKKKKNPINKKLKKIKKKKKTKQKYVKETKKTIKLRIVFF